MLGSNATTDEYELNENPVPTVRNVPIADKQPPRRSAVLTSAVQDEDR